jgi:hypothetical protein
LNLELFMDQKLFIMVKQELKNKRPNLQALKR